jgi:hypothetical protein
MRKREFAMQMRKCKKAINRCNAITFKSLANAKMDSHYQPCHQRLSDIKLIQISAFFSFFSQD